jgi:cell division septum initiation protein DivIVA
MAKALLGHVGIGPDLRLAEEVRRLQRRIKELEAELAEARSTEALEAAVSTPDLMSLEQREPAYSS